MNFTGGKNVGFSIDFAYGPEHSVALLLLHYLWLLLLFHFLD